MFAGNQSTLAIACIAVRVIRGISEFRHRASASLPTQHPIIGYIAPEQDIAVTKPNRALIPTAANPQTLERRISSQTNGKPIVQYFYSWVWVSHRLLPISIK
jgi:hypothetical protein